MAAVTVPQARLTVWRRKVFMDDENTRLAFLGTDYEGAYELTGVIIRVLNFDDEGGMRFYEVTGRLASPLPGWLLTEQKDEPLDLPVIADKDRRPKRPRVRAKKA